MEIEISRKGKYDLAKMDLPDLEDLSLEIARNLSSLRSQLMTDKAQPGNEKYDSDWHRRAQTAAEHYGFCAQAVDTFLDRAKNRGRVAWLKAFHRIAKEGLPEVLYNNLIDAVQSSIGGEDALPY